jgi:heat-inducible transcriptional repressor
MTLTSRQRSILRAVVEAYLATGRPVSSGAVAERERALGLSSATLRSEMALLESEGYLAQPHTSAGRVPTERGLRAWVDASLTEKLHPWDRTHLDAAAEAADPVAYATKLGQLVAGITSEMTVVALPSFIGTSFREIGLARLRAGVFVAYFVSPGGLVQEKLVHVDFDLTQEELTSAQNFLNERLAGRSLEQVRTLIAAELADDAARRDRLRRSALELGIRALPEPDIELRVEGARHLAEKPELANAGTLQRLLTAIEEKKVLLAVLDQILDGKGDVHVLIGSEHQVTEMPELSCIGMPLASAGAITVLGPVRMDYARLVPLVRYAASLFGRRWEAL